MKKILIILLSTYSIVANAQWTKTTCPSGGAIQCLATNSSTIFAGTLTAGIFLSTDNGATWSAANSGITNTNILSLITNGTTIFAGTSGGGVFVSTNNGTSWIAANNGLTNLTIRSMAINGTSIFAGTDFGGIFLSTNNGASWAPINNGLTNYSSNVIWTLVENAGIIYAGASGEIFSSSNNGSTWVSLGTMQNFADVKSIAVSGNNIFIGAQTQGVLLSTNNGTTWTQANTGINNLYTTSFVLNGTNIIAGTLIGAFISSNNGSSWTSLNTNNLTIWSMAINNTSVFLGTWNDGVWVRSINSITNISNIETPKNNMAIYPNPSSNGKFTLENKETIKQLTITDISGKIILQHVTSQKKTEIDLSSYANGLYYLKLVDENNNITTKKIVKQ